MKLCNGLVIAIAAIAAAMVNGSVATADVIPVTNAGFDAPNLHGGYAYGSTDVQNNPGTMNLPYSSSVATSGWTFEGQTGIAANGSNFFVSGATGGQAAFIQYIAGGVYHNSEYQYATNSISQTLTGFTGGDVTVSFDLESRAVYGGVPIDVYLNGVKVGTYSATSTTSFNLITTAPISEASGPLTLTFVADGAGITKGDYTTFIDNVSVEATSPSFSIVPEPSSLALLGFGGIGLAFRSIRRLFGIKQ